MSASIKGTTRVSSNDRKLMKDLWVASKDNPSEKNRQKRKLTQNEKQTRENMPEERGKSAFRSLLKKQKTFDGHFETRKSDDPIAIQTIQQPTWSDFCARQSFERAAVEQAEQFCKFLKTLKKRQNMDTTFKKMLEWVQPVANAFYACQESSESFHFLGEFKNKRFSNYRQRCDLNAIKSAKQLTDDTLRKLSFVKEPKDEAKKTVELEFTTDYESIRHPRIILKCDHCGENVPANIAKNRENRLFFHPDCFQSTPRATGKEIKKFAFQIFSLK